MPARPRHAGLQVGDQVELRDRRVRAGDDVPDMTNAQRRQDGRAWAGNGSGLNQCVCCAKMIGRLDREFEPRAATGLHAHGPCYRVWLAESLGLRMYEPYEERQ